MTDVFLSYASKDREAASLLQGALSRAGFVVFWDQETPTGQDWDQWIRAKLSNARVVIVLWSAHSMASPNVRHEAMIARDAGKLLPIAIEDVSPTDLPMGLYMVQTMRMFGTTEQRAQALERLVMELRSRTSDRSETTAPQVRSAKPDGVQRGTRPTWRPRRAVVSVASIVGVGLAIALGLSLWPERPEPVPAAVPEPPIRPAKEVGSNTAKTTQPAPRVTSLDTAHALLTAYYAAMKEPRKFDASEFFAPDVSHWLLLDRAKFSSIDYITESVRARSRPYPGYLEEGSLTRQGLHSFVFREKSTAKRDYRPSIEVDINPAGKITRMQTVQGRRDSDLRAP